MTDEEIFELVRQNYAKANSEYIAEQIRIAMQYVEVELV